MAVANKQIGPGLKHRKIKRGPLAHSVVVHVAAVWPEPARPNSLLVWRRNGNAPEHGLQLDPEVLKVLGGLGQHGESILPVKLPLAIEFVVELGVAHIARIESAVDYPVTATSRVAIETNAVEFHYQRVAGHSAFHVERTSFRIAAIGAALAGGIAATCVHCSGADGITR